MQEGLKPLTVYEREYLEDELKRAENSLAIELEMEPGSHAACFKLATTIKALKAALTRPADSPKAAKVELVERLEQHLKDCVDYIETHRPMNTRRCKEWEDANHFLLYDWLEANRAALQPKPEAKDWLTRSDLLWWRNWFLQRKEAKGELFAFERVALNVLDMALAALTPSPKDALRDAHEKLVDVAKLVVMLGSDDPRISDEDRLLALRDNSPLVGEARLALKALAPQAEPIGEREDG